MTVTDASDRKSPIPMLAVVGVTAMVTAWQPAVLGASRPAVRHTAVRLDAGVVEEKLVVDGQPMEVRRFVEAEVRVHTCSRARELCFFLAAPAHTQRSAVLRRSV